jgi:hypothetical protein
MAPIAKPVDVRFWAKVDIKPDADACWPWSGSYFRAAKGSGPYGCFTLSTSTNVLSHRMAFELANNKTPGDFKVRHTCDNPKCCNPKHLVLGSHQDNMNDRRERARTARGERGGTAKLTSDEVIEIRMSPLSNKDIRQKYGISDTSIRDIKTRRSWIHV